MQELTINQELKSFQPDCKGRPPMDMLESCIKMRGAICPIIAWNNTIVDGHRSYELYRKHNIPFKVFQADFKSLEDAKLWVYENLMDDEQRKKCKRPNPSERSVNPVPEGYWSQRHRKQSYLLMIPLQQIKINCDTQIRDQINPQLVQEYAEAMKRGERFQPIRVFQETPESDYILVDGFHRYFAHQEVHPDLLIAAEIEDGGVDDARWASCAVNTGHGAQRTKKELHNAVRRAILHPKGRSLSNYAISEHVKVSESTVRRIRNEMESTTSMTQSSERVGRDGRVIQTAKIGKVKGVAKKPDEKVKIVDCSKPLPPDPAPSKDNHETPLVFPSKESAAETTREFFRRLHDRYGDAVTKPLVVELHEQYGQ